MQAKLANKSVHRKRLIEYKSISWISIVLRHLAVAAEDYLLLSGSFTFCSTCYRETLSRPVREMEHGVVPSQRVLVGLFWKCLYNFLILAHFMQVL